MICANDAYLNPLYSCQEMLVEVDPLFYFWAAYVDLMWAHTLIALRFLSWHIFVIEILLFYVNLGCNLVY